MNLYKKLLDCKKKIPYLKRDGKGYNYKYVTPSKVFAEVNPILNDAGILLLTKVVDCKTYEIKTGKGEKEKSEWKYDLQFMFCWVDTEDNETIEIPWFASGVNGEDKGLGSALTYAERYFILKQFNIPTDDDDPDNFQDKHMTDAEKKAKADAEKAAKEKAITDATKLINDCTTLEKLQETYLALPDDLKITLKKVTNEKKAALTPAPTPATT